MNKELDAFLRLEQNSKRYKGRKEDLDTIFTALKDKEQQDQIIKTIKEFAPLITINIKGKEYDIKANNTSDIALYAELYINDRLIYSTMNRDKIEKLALLKEVLL